MYFIQTQVSHADIKMKIITSVLRYLLFKINLNCIILYNINMKLLKNYDFEHIAHFLFFIHSFSMR